MQIDTLSQINEVINSLVKKGNFKQANNLNQLFLKMAQTAPNAGGAPAVPGGAAPTGPTGASTPPTGKPQESPNTANKQPTVDMMNIIKQFYVLKNWAKENKRFYSFSRNLFYTDDNEGKRVSAKNVGDLLAPLGVERVDIQELAGEAQQLANNIIREISSASSWTDASPEASQAINAKYDLGYNFEESKYYIGDPNSTDDVIFRDKVSDLETIYKALGQYYNSNQKKLPSKLTEVESGMTPGAKQTDTNAPGGNAATPGQPGGPSNPVETASAGDIMSAIA
jgi:hypothetical protein